MVQKLSDTALQNLTHWLPIYDDRDLKGKLLLHLRDYGLQRCTLG
jgi:hypothetical protein